MKRIFDNYVARLGLVLMLFLPLAGCEKYEAPEPDCRRMVLVYMEASNSLSGSATSDINEMLSAKIPADCRLLVYLSAYGSAPQLLEIKNGRRVVLATYPEETSAVDPAQMTRVIAEARRIAPSREAGLVLWSHSSGWQQTSLKARAYGLENSSRQMSVSDLAMAVANQGLDFIVFDTCYMGCVEVAYELRHAARYMVASVCEVPTDGMPYQLTLPALFDADMAGGLCRAVDVNVDYYLPRPKGTCPSTLSVIDLSAMDALADAVKECPAELPADYEPQVFSVSRPFRYLFFDLGQYLAAAGGDTDALDRAVIHERHTSSIWGVISLDHCSGLSVYLPQFAEGYDYDSHGYSSLEWAKYLNLKN